LNVSKDVAKVMS